MKAVILESYVMEEGDLDWSGVKALVPDTTSYVRTDYADIAPRIGDAELVLINNAALTKQYWHSAQTSSGWASSPPVRIISTLKPAAVMGWQWPTCRAILLTAWRR